MYHNKKVHLPLTDSTKGYAAGTLFHLPFTMFTFFL